MDQVSAAAQRLTTENGTVVEQKRITGLPLNGRNFLSFAAVSPNVTFGFGQAAGRQCGSRANLTMSIAGACSARSNYTLDGITNTDINFNLYIVLRSVEPKNGSWPCADRHNPLNLLRVSTAAHFTSLVTSDTVANACGPERFGKGAASTAVFSVKDHDFRSETDGLVTPYGI